MRSDSLHPAPVVAGNSISDYAGKATSILVFAVVAFLLFPVGDCGRPGHDHLRVIVEFEILWPATGAADTAGTGSGVDGCALGNRDSSFRRSAAPWRVTTHAASRLRDVS